MSDTAAGTATEPDAPEAKDQVTPAQAADADAPDGTGDEPTSLSPEDARKLRSESRSLRQRLKAAEEELEKRKDADLTERQKLERDATTARAELEQAQTTARNLRVQVSAAKLGVRPDAVDLVVNAIDWESIDDADDAKQVESAIKTLVKERPFLSARPEGLDGGNGRGAGSRGETDMNSLIRRAAGRS